MPKQSKPKAWVKAAPGRGNLKRRVLQEGSRKRFITEDEPVEVELTAYYLRRLANGELLKVATPGWSASLEVVDTEETPAAPAVDDKE